MTRTTVLLPTFNHAPWLPRALHSLCNQTLSDIRIVVVDDGSTDETPTILQRLAREDPRIETVTIPHGGIVAALNAGLAGVNTPYIARMDADDICHEERLAIQVAHLDANPRCGAVDSMVTLLESDRTGQGMVEHIRWMNSLTTWDAIRSELFVESPMVHPAVTMRTEALVAAGGYIHEPGPEDYSLWLRMAAAGYELHKVAQDLLTWSDLPGRLTRNDPHYEAIQMHALKAKMLPKIHPETAREGVRIWGAGPTAKLSTRALRKVGIFVHEFYDVDPKKIGNPIAGGVPVLNYQDLTLEGPLLLVALGSRGPKEETGKWLFERGFVAERDFLFFS